MVKKAVLINIIIFSFFASTVMAIESESVEASQSLTINLRTQAESYLLGELIPLDIEFVNSSPEAIYLFGSTEILVSNGTNDYLTNAYFGRGYSFEGVDLIKIEPNARFRTKLSILWNSPPNVSHLAPDVAKRLSEGRILAEYAFMDPGEYLVRVRHNFKSEKNIRLNKFTSVDSKPVGISIVEPKGEDLEVWNIIKQNGEFAFLTQNGDFYIPIHKAEERAALVGMVEQLIASHPKTVYAKAFRKSLEIYRLREIKRNAEIEVLKRLSRPDFQICQLNLCRYDQKPR